MSGQGEAAACRAMLTRLEEFEKGLATVKGIPTELKGNLGSGDLSATAFATLVGPTQLLAEHTHHVLQHVGALKGLLEEYAS